MIYNLTIVENIALIKEVHERMEIGEAQRVAMGYLRDISLEHIADKRVNECTLLEILIAMIIRAMMTREASILIEVSHTIVDSVHEIEALFTIIKSLQIQKSVQFLDLIDNQTYYEGYRCNIIK